MLQTDLQTTVFHSETFIHEVVLINGHILHLYILTSKIHVSCTGTTVLYKLVSIVTDMITFTGLVA